MSTSGEREPLPTGAKIIVVAAVAWLLAAVLAGPTLLINLYEDSLASGKQLVPSLWKLREALSYLPILAAGAVGTWLFTKGRRALPLSTRARHFTALILLLLWTFLGASVAMFGILATSDAFIFPTTQPSASYPSRDGKRVAHLLYDCFLGCTLSYAIEEPGRWWISRTPVWSGKAEDASKLPAIEWVDDQRFVFKSEDPAMSTLAGRTFPEPAAE